MPAVDHPAVDHPSARGDAIAASAEWATRPERSSLFWLRVMSWISLRLGRRAGKVFLLPIVAYFLLFAGAARRAARAYLRRVLGRSPRLRDLYAHFHCFASTLHDRVYLVNDRFDLFSITTEGEDAIERLMGAGRGVFLMGAHLGSFEVLRALSRTRPGVRISMVMYEHNARKLNAALAAINPVATRDIIALGTIDSMLRVRQRLEEGAQVGVLGDRGLGDDQTAPVQFLGGTAQLPVGPFRMAALLKHPIVFMAGLYLGGNRYAIHFEPLADFSDVEASGRNAAVRAAMQNYAARLEHYCRQAPYNWFNFFDFWNDGLER